MFLWSNSMSSLKGPSINEIMKKMGQINEPGLRNTNLKLEESKSPRLSNQANSLVNATMAYEKMTGYSRKEEDVLKKMGAVTAIKELTEEITKENVDEKLMGIRKILGNF